MCKSQNSSSAYVIKDLLKLISAQVRTNICSCQGSYAIGKENKFYQETSAPLGT